ncbi:replication initiation protein [Helicobacter rodentium]|uniref:replication initiation protein n=1 Tax=Helicobacter rodentium TaxID=59617 RepID=UPI0023561615|nr:replication initiation protein [Helicobacter rodentium]
MYLIDFYYSCDNKGYVLNLIRDRRTSAKLKYGNEINSIEFIDFTAQDFNLFFSICWFINNKQKQSQIKKITLSFDELKKFIPQNKIMNLNRFYNDIVKFARKLRKITIDIETNEITQNGESNSLGKSDFFARETLVDSKTKTLTIIMGDLVLKALFNFNYFTKFDLNEFCSIKNKYTKTLFRLLKQYENVNENPVNGLKNIVMEKQEFLEFMNCPEKYMNNMSMYVDKKILIPAIDELNKGSQSFKNVSYQKIKEGGMIKKFEISFQTIKPA